MRKDTEGRGGLELLAPARDWECGKTAINCGADAVYIGGPSFSARSQAGNSMADIERLARYAHRFNARVYMALNTLFFDKELEEAKRLGEQAWQAGVDALIVQDMAVAEFGLPIPLHASTQCDNRTALKVSFLEKCGFSQVVLARELSLADISEIADKTSVRLEFFIHGALCVSFSGLCNLSRHMSGRSANRGTCAQPCRLPWKVSGASTSPELGKHLLSLKDMNQSGNLGLLAKAGISSFKIEGRLKDANYVRNITAHYRRELDQFLEGNPNFARTSSGRSTVAFHPDPQKSFNRGHTAYFIEGDGSDIPSMRSPKWIGEPVGKAGEVERNWLTVKGGGILGNGDGLTFFDEEGLLRGLRVNRVEGRKVFPAAPYTPPPPGAPLYRNCDAAYECLLESGSEKRKIAVNAIFHETPAGFGLRLTDEDGNVALAEVVADKTPARDCEAALKTLRANAAKLGDTIFELTGLTIDLRETWFLPVSLINGLRREAAGRLLEVREKAYRLERRSEERQPPAVWPGGVAGPETNVTNRLAKKFYESHGAVLGGKAWEISPVTENTPLMITKHCLRRAFGLCARRGGARNAQPVEIRNGETRLLCRFDCRECVMTVLPAPDGGSGEDPL